MLLHSTFCTLQHGTLQQDRLPTFTRFFNASTDQCCKVIKIQAVELRNLLTFRLSFNLYTIYVYFL